MISLAATSSALSRGGWTYRSLVSNDRLELRMWDRKATNLCQLLAGRDELGGMKHMEGQVTLGGILAPRSKGVRWLHAAQASLHPNDTAVVN